MELFNNPVHSVIRSQLNNHLEALETKLGADVLAFFGPILFGMDEEVRRAVEADHDARKRKSKLAVILDTPGGIVEVVERMVDTIRHHYHEVAFFIPDRAMSAGTVFALSGDQIFMDYFSVLGPIDPQIAKDNKLVPALSYLVQFERLKNRAANGVLTTAEMVLLQKLDLGELQQFEEARELSISLLKKWLVKYKFKNWNRTDTNKHEVTLEYKQQRAEAIAKTLSDHQLWHSHGRGISMAELRGDSIKLKIDDFGEDQELAKRIKEYFVLCRDFMSDNDIANCVQTRNAFYI